MNTILHNIKIEIRNNITACNKELDRLDEEKKKVIARRDAFIDSIVCIEREEKSIIPPPTN